MAKLHFLNDEEAALFRRMAQEFMAAGGGRLPSAAPGAAGALAPELYLVRPAEGDQITALLETECEVYRRHLGSVEALGFTVIVWNPFHTSCALADPSTYAIASRDKFGQWLLLQCDCIPPESSPSTPPSSPPPPPPGGGSDAYYCVESKTVSGLKSCEFGNPLSLADAGWNVVSGPWASVLECQNVGNCGFGTA